jgi:predicted MPP superfamily phosphohydrolase
MKIAGSSLGIGVLYSALPVLARGESGEVMRRLGKQNGEQMTPFSFVQLSDAHVGFNGPPDPLGTKAFERAVEMINAAAPDLVLFTGALTHDTEEKDVHAQRMKQFQEICKRMKVGKVMYVPGEHDAGLDGDQLETAFAEEIKRTVTVGGKKDVNPIPADAENIQAGQNNFAHYCLVCHGLDGQNTGVPFADRMSPPGPPLNSAVVQRYTDG